MTCERNRPSEAIYNAFHAKIKAINNDKGHCLTAILNIQYVEKYTNKLETRCLVYDCAHDGSVLENIRIRMKDTNATYDTVKATSRRFLINDEEDFYGAFIYHLTNKQVRESDNIEIILSYEGRDQK